jgi:hypothetical protein
MYKYKLKEVELGDTKIIKGKKHTVSDIDPETNSISWDISTTPNFESSFKMFSQLKKALKTLSSKKDSKLDLISTEVDSLFNEFRTHLRKKYPDEYKLFKSINEDSIAYSSPKVFKPNPNFKYKLKEGTDAYTDFQKKQINIFDELEEKLNSLYPLISNAQNFTTKYYNENPGSFKILYSTEIINKFLDDIKKILESTPN